MLKNCKGFIKKKECGGFTFNCIDKIARIARGVTVVVVESRLGNQCSNHERDCISKTLRKGMKPTIHL